MGHQTRHHQQRAPAPAAPLVRHPRTAIQRRPARGAGNARPRQHLHHAGLHAPRFPVSEQDLRRGASACQEETMNTSNSKRSSFRRRPEPKKSPLPQPLSRQRERVAVRPGEGAPTILLKPGREKSLLRRHPWVFSGAIERVDGAPLSGDTLPVRDASGNFLAWAAYNANSQITARIWSWHEEDSIDAEFFRRRIANALAARNELNLADKSNGMRLIHAESDGLPGLVVDQYGNTLVMQVGSAGAERWRDAIADILQQLCNPACIYERSDSDSRGLEGFEPRNGVLRGALPESVEVVEHGQIGRASC